MNKTARLITKSVFLMLLVFSLGMVALGAGCTEGSWSEWSTTKSAEYLSADPVNQQEKLQYCFKDIQKTTVKTYSEKTTLVQQGWSWDSSTAKTGTPVTSGWSTTKPSAMENRTINQKTVSTVTGYRYKRYVYKNTSDGKTYFSYGDSWAKSKGYSGSWKFKQTTSKLPYYKTYDGKYAAYGNSADYWWQADCNTKQGTSYNGQDYTIFEVKSSHTEYQTLDYPYTLTKWPANYSDWSFTPVEAVAGQREVQTRTVYSYRTTTHRFTGEPVIVKYPTCTEEGSMYQTCSACGTRVYTTIPMRDHEYSSEWTIDTPATCLVFGSKSHHCLVCGKKKDVTLILPLGHSAGTEWYTSQQPTCTTKGVKYQKCSRCGQTMNKTSIPALGHSVTEEWFISKAATCTTTGTKYQKCSTCGQAVNETEIAALGHKFTKKIEPASLSKDGKIFTWCSACGKIGSSQSISKIEKVQLNKTTFDFTGRAITPKVTVTDKDGKQLVKNQDYKIKLSSGRKECGKYNVKVTFIGNYTGTKKLAFKIQLAKVTGLKQLKKEGIQIQWNKVTGATRYQIQSYDKKQKQWVPAGESKSCVVGNKDVRNVTTKFRVRAVRDTGVGPWATITVKARSK